MNKLIFALIAVILTFTALTNPIYDNCRNTIEGYTCDLVGYEWVKSQ